MVNIVKNTSLTGPCTRWYWNAILHFLVLLMLQSQLSFCGKPDNILLILSKSLSCYKTSSLVTFGCWPRRDELTLMKYVMQQQVFVKMYNLNDGNISLRSLKAEYKPVTVVLNMQCQKAYEVLRKASEENLFRQLHYWLLLENENATIREVSIQDTLSELNITLDSQVHIVQQGSKIIVQSAYRIKDGMPLIITPPNEWNPDTSCPSSPRRDDLGGISLKAAVIVIDEQWENFLDMRYRHLNTVSKIGYVLTCYLAKMLNFRMELSFTDTWGFPINNSDQYSGLVGLLQRNSVDIGATTLFIKPARLDRIDYAAEAFPFAGKMMFMKPSLSEMSILYLLPFSNTVWATIVALVTILTAALLITSRWEQKITDSDTLSWGEAVIYTIGIVCQQGSPRHPETIPSRIILLLLLLLSLFLVASYSAIIVSLLQMPSSAIRTLTELLDSSFQMSMRNVSYSTAYVNDTNDPAVKRLYFEKLATQPYDKAFTTQKVGIAKVRKGFHAFQGDPDAYKVISDTYEEHEKCRYAEITVFVSNIMAYPVRKHSPLKEFMARKARWLREIGFTDREYKQWYHQKPKCNNNVKSFVTVRIQDFYPALLVMAYGAIASVCILGVELLYYNIQKARKSHIKQLSNSFTKRKDVYPTKQLKIAWYNK